MTSSLRSAARQLVRATCAVALSVCLVGVSASCKGEPKEAGTTKQDVDDDNVGRTTRFKPRPIEDERTIRALEAEVASLRRQLQNDKADARTGLINAHEHLRALPDLEKYLPAARKAGVATTVIVASPQFTLDGQGNKGEPTMSRNFEDVVLPAAKEHPGEIIPFCTVDPHDADKLDRLRKHVEMGARGVKIYTGHSNFYDGPLDPPDMDAVWNYLEQQGLPIVWHVNLAKFMPEFTRVLDKHPKLNMMVPHYGVVFWKPADLQRLAALMRSHPTLLIDTSLGTREILLDGMAAIEPAVDAFRAFFDEFQDRIIWGTDSVITSNPEKTPGWFSKVIWATRDHLEKEVFSTELAAGYSRYYQKGRDGEGRYRGLALPPAMLQKLYVDNAKRWLRLP